MQKTKVAKQSRTSREMKVRKKSALDHDLVSLAALSKAHEWLASEEEDIYSPKDGRPASWPKRSTDAAA